MVILEELSSIMLPPTRNLQIVGIDEGTAMQSIDDLVIALKAMRCEEVFSQMFTCSQTIAQSLNIEIVKPRAGHFRKSANCGFPFMFADLRN